jgi:GT2 family glycosyltransferase
MASGEWLLFTDDDVIVPQDWIERMLERCAAHGVTALCGGIAPYSLEHRIERYLHYRVQGALGRRAGPIKAAPMMNFLLTRSRFEAAGGFLEEPLKAAEDWEFCRRLTRDGLPIIYDPVVKVIHRYQRDAGPAIARMRDAGAAGVSVWLKGHRGAALYTAYSIARAVAAPIWIPARYPLDLFVTALHMEWVFAGARARTYLNHLQGRSVAAGA